MTAPRIARVTLLLAMGGALLLALPSAFAQSAPAVITVVFTADDAGFTATSTKDISNIIVVLCDETQHKHEFQTAIKVFVHSETQDIAGVYVKSGNNGIAGNIPPGAGQFFANEGVSCGSSSTTTTSGSETTTTTGSETTTTTGSDTTTTTSETETPTTEVPFFGAPAVMGLGIAGAAGGALFMLRRRM